MNCQSFENSITDLARQHPIEATALKEALSHSESCVTCARKIEEQRALTLRLRSLANELKAVQIPNRIEEQLVRALREQALQPKRAQALNRRWLGVALAAAAVLLIVVGIMGLRARFAATPPLISDQKSPVLENPRDVGPTMSPTGTIPTPVKSSDQENQPGPNYRRPRRVEAKHRPKRVPDSSLTAAKTVNGNAHATAPEVTTEFMPLGNVGLANLQEGAQVVRVEMPRYAMARFGLPVNMERYDETVKADVWVGIDGVARAIRFVQ